MVFLDAMQWLGGTLEGAATIVGTFAGTAVVAAFSAAKLEKRRRAKDMAKVKPTFDSDAPASAIVSVPSLEERFEQLQRQALETQRTVAEMAAWDLEAARAETRRCQYDNEVLRRELHSTQQDLKIAHRQLDDLRRELAMANSRIHELERKAGSPGGALPKPTRSGVRVKEEYARDSVKKDQR